MKGLTFRVLERLAGPTVVADCPLVEDPGHSSWFWAPAWEERGLHGRLQPPASEGHQSFIRCSRVSAEALLAFKPQPSPEVY